jgi:hypothetical protein
MQCALAQSVGISAAPASGARGGLASFPLSVTATGGAQPVALQWTIRYSASDVSSLSLTIAGTAAVASKTLACAQTAGSMTCLIYGMNTTTIADGVIAQVVVGLSATTGATSTTLQVTGVVAATAAGDSIQATGTGNQIIIQSSTRLTGLACSPVTIIGSGSVNCTVSLTAPAPSVGFPVALSSSNANLTLPVRITVPGGSKSASFLAHSAAVTTDQFALVSASANGVLESSYVFLAAPTQLTSLSCSPAKIPSGTSAVCTVTMSQASGGAVVALSSGNAVLSMPASVTVAPGTTSATFAVAASGATNQVVALTASWNGTQVAISVTVLPPSATFSFQGNPSEIQGVTNGALITPTIAPAGLTGTVVVNGRGSVNFAPDKNGNGVYFLSCCANINNAYYKFTGMAVGSIFDFNQGQISFSLTSRYDLAQRASASSFRAVLDVRDGAPSNHLVTFITQEVSGRIAFSYLVGRTPNSYYLPQGFEDALFGSGVTIHVTLTWAGDRLNLYLNGSLAQSSTYRPPAQHWTSDSILDLGGYEYDTLGGYDSCDDIIAGFTVGPVTQN